MGAPSDRYLWGPATYVDVYELVYRGIRQEDLDEWAAGTGLPIEASLPDAVRASETAHAVTLDGAPLALWGIQPSGRSDVRLVWFIASRDAPSHAIAIHRHFKPAMAELQPRGVSLAALSYWRNIKHHRWLEAHGFALAGIHASRLGIPYLSFVRDPPP